VPEIQQQRIEGLLFNPLDSIVYRWRNELNQSLLW